MSASFAANALLILQAAANLATVLGVAFAIWQYRKWQRQQLTLKSSQHAEEVLQGLLDIAEGLDDCVPRASLEFDGIAALYGGKPFHRYYEDCRRVLGNLPQLKSELRELSKKTIRLSALGIYSHEYEFLDRLQKQVREAELCLWDAFDRYNEWNGAADDKEAVRHAFQIAEDELRKLSAVTSSDLRGDLEIAYDHLREAIRMTKAAN
ncbi:MULTISPECIES: hypothetical protein [unclassified Thioclava]|uniref:hypothetical protein n=1 Tax=unclassified Thioclava TaxID=2621713 RepID=UPI0009CB2614|nr:MULTISPECIES: hypothetical protein [unclassified Thioclava]OOY03856.1 hypothetical protein BMI87_15735 [Thioclava sp. F28-4]